MYALVSKVYILAPFERAFLPFFPMRVFYIKHFWRLWVHWFWEHLGRWGHRIVKFLLLEITLCICSIGDVTSVFALWGSWRHSTGVWSWMTPVLVRSCCSSTCAPVGGVALQSDCALVTVIERILCCYDIITPWRQLQL